MPAAQRVCFALSAAAMVALTSLSAQSPAPQGPPVFRGDAGLVPVDVRVIDKAGKPVTDLTQADFTLIENGVPQRIEHFSTQALTAETPAPGARLERRVTSQPATLTSRNYRVFLIVLGRGRLDGPANGLDGMMHLVHDRLLPQDRVSVFAWNRATGFTLDHERVVELLQRFKRGYQKVDHELQLASSGLAWLYGSHEIPDGIQRDIDAIFGGPRALEVRTPAAGASQSAEEAQRTRDLFQAPGTDAVGETLLSNLGMTLDEYVQSSAQTGQDLANLYAGLDYLAQIDGEKHLLWVTEEGLTTVRGEDEQDLARAASDARVVIDIVRTGGTVFASPVASGAEARRPPSVAAVNRPGMASLQSSATSRLLAQQTGGRYDANRFPNASVDVDHISADSSFQYLLGYYPANAAWDDKYRAITVRVNRPGLTVMYRHGYFARKDVTPLDPRGALTYSRMVSVARSAKEIKDLGLRATAALSKTAAAPEVVVTMTVDISHVMFAKTNNLNVASVELAAFCLDKKQKAAGNAWKTLSITLTNDRYARVLQDGLPVTLTVPATGPVDSVKVVAYDYDADLVGSVNVKMTP